MTTIPTAVGYINHAHNALAKARYAKTPRCRQQQLDLALKCTIRAASIIANVDIDSPDSITKID